MPKNRAILATASASLLTLAACEQAAEPASEPPTDVSHGDPEIQSGGTTVEVRMISVDDADEGAPVRFEPRLITARVGDTIRITPTASEHEAASIATMLPEGVDGFEAEPGEPISFVVSEAGIYGIQCVPHYAAGSVGVIVVEGADNDADATANLDKARAADHPGRANPEFFEIFEEADRRGLLD